MVGYPITLRLPDGTSAAVMHDDAWKLQQLLWARGLAPGAAAAAGKLRDSTSSWSPEARPVIDFNTREAVAVAAAASGWITWTNDNDTTSV